MTRISGSATAFAPGLGVPACCANEKLDATTAATTMPADKIRTIARAAGLKTCRLELKIARIQNSPTRQFCHGRSAYRKGSFAKSAGNFRQSPTSSSPTGSAPIVHPTAIARQHGPMTAGYGRQAFA